MGALRNTCDYFGYERYHGYLRAKVTQVPVVAVAAFAARFTYVHRVLGFRFVDTSSLVKIMTTKECSLFVC